MRITYRNKDVERLCTDVRQMKKELPAQTVPKLQTLLTRISLLQHMDEFRLPVFARYRYHELTGDKKGIKSLSIDYSYRLTLTIEIVGIGTDCDEIRILEVTNHYGD